jgi:hypothetical protein
LLLFETSLDQVVTTTPQVIVVDISELVVAPATPPSAEPVSCPSISLQNYLTSELNNPVDVQETDFGYIPVGNPKVDGEFPIKDIDLEYPNNAGPLLSIRILRLPQLT